MANKIKQETYYSTDGEYYSYLDLYDAIDSVIGDLDEFPKVGDIIEVYEGVCSFQRAGFYCRWLGSVALERAYETAYDYAGEVSESWLDNVSGEEEQELSAMLQKAFDEWATLHGLQPRFGMIEDSKKIKVRITEIDEFSFEYEEIIHG